MIKTEIKTTFKGDQLKKIAIKANGATLEELVISMVAQAKHLCPVKKGFLRSTIGWTLFSKNSGSRNSKLGKELPKPKNAFEAFYGTPCEYSPDVEFGTAPHFIRPVNAKALAFKYKAGKMVFTKLVKHPGTKAQPFIRPPINLMLEGEFLTIARKHGKNEFKEYLK